MKVVDSADDKLGVCMENMGVGVEGIQGLV